MATTLAFPKIVANWKFDITLRNVKVADDWITGDVEICAEVFGQKLDESIPFKTKSGVNQTVDLPYGARATLRGYLKEAHQVCSEVKLHWGRINSSSGEHCIQV